MQRVLTVTTSGRNGRQLENRAKTTFSAIVEAAQHGEPTIVTKHGLPAAMIVPMRGDSAFYRPSFAELLLSIPNLNVEGDQSPMPEDRTRTSYQFAPGKSGRPKPAHHFCRWFLQNTDSRFLSAILVVENAAGIEKLRLCGAERRASDLDNRFNRIIAIYAKEYFHWIRRSAITLPPVWQCTLGDRTRSRADPDPAGAPMSLASPANSNAPFG